MTAENERDVVTIPGWIGFGVVVLIVLGLFGWGCWWLFVVPGDSTRAMLCPKHEGRAEALRSLSEVRPLRDYEIAAWQASDEYFQRWCQ
jgi:hypothetical protein